MICTATQRGFEARSNPGPRHTRRSALARSLRAVTDSQNLSLGVVGYEKTSVAVGSNIDRPNGPKSLNASTHRIGGGDDHRGRSNAAIRPNIHTSKNSALPIIMTPGLAAGLLALTIFMCAISALAAIMKVIRIDPAMVFAR